MSSDRSAPSWKTAATLFPMDDDAWADETAEYREFRGARPLAQCDPSLLRRPSRRSILRHLTTDDAGRVWMERAIPEGFVWDVLDAEGAWLAEVSASLRVLLGSSRVLWGHPPPALGGIALQIGLAVGGLVLAHLAPGFFPLTALFLALAGLFLVLVALVRHGMLLVRKDRVSECKIGTTGKRARKGRRFAGSRCSVAAAMAARDRGCAGVLESPRHARCQPIRSAVTSARRRQRMRTGAATAGVPLVVGSPAGRLLVARAARFRGHRSVLPVEIPRFDRPPTRGTPSILSGFRAWVSSGDPGVLRQVFVTRSPKTSLNPLPDVVQRARQLVVVKTWWGEATICLISARRASLRERGADRST